MPADVVHKDAWDALESRKVASGDSCWWCEIGEEYEQICLHRPELARMISESRGEDMRKAGVGSVEWSVDGCQVHTVDGAGPRRVATAG